MRSGRLSSRIFATAISTDQPNLSALMEKLEEKTGSREVVVLKCLSIL